MRQLVLLQERTTNLFQVIASWFAHQLDDQKSKGAIASLDGVRAIACIIVVLFHSTSLIYWRWDIDHKPLLAALNYTGAHGVTLFFVLSGFLLFLPYAKALLFEKAWPQARMFYLRRILRIIPGYYFALFMILLLEKPYYLQISNWKTVLAFLTFFMTGQQSGQINGVYWTLAVEFQYYMILPLIALGIYGLTRLVPLRQRLWMVIGSLFILIAWGLATRQWGTALFSNADSSSLLHNNPFLKYVTFFIYGATNADHGKYLEDFAVGMLLVVSYVVVTQSPHKEMYQQRLLRFSPWLWWLGIVLLVCAAWRNANYLPYWPIAYNIFPFYPDYAIEVTFALGFAFCMLAILFNGTGRLNKFFSWTPLRWIGLISFSLYLWHEPVIAALEAYVAPSLFHHFHGLMTVAIFAIIELVVVLSLSFTLYILIEKPGMRVSERLRNTRSSLATQAKQNELAVLANMPNTEVNTDLERIEPRQSAIRPETLYRS